MSFYSFSKRVLFKDAGSVCKYEVWNLDPFGLKGVLEKRENSGGLIFSFAPCITFPPIFFSSNFEGAFLKQLLL
jgi:hypothetical protein